MVQEELLPGEQREKVSYVVSIEDLKKILGVDIHSSTTSQPLKRIDKASVNLTGAFMFI
ncbi:hypothetical protein [Ammoniphilus sp. 3BR4]|uniref:hypothetical protein n=1 Tax=Ammoniphilus sp. 3BR4 TaxID=3158265 RepID=UPI0034671593